MKRRTWSLWLVLRHCVALAIVVGASFSALGQSGLNITPPVALNSNAARDIGDDYGPQIVTDGLGVWLVMWVSDDDLDGTIGTDQDLLFSRSTDNGATWSDPRALNTNAGTDIGRDGGAQLVTDRKGRWIVVWSSTDDLGGSIGDDSDVLFARSDDDGATWTAPLPLDLQAYTDERNDGFKQVSTDGDGSWIAAWTTSVGQWNDDLFFVRSSDNGASWSAPERLNTDSPEERGIKDVREIRAYGRGEWLIGWSTEDTSQTGPQHFGSWVVRSDDNGASWSPATGRTGQITRSEGAWLQIGAGEGRGPEGFCFNASSVWYYRSDDQGVSWSDSTRVLTPLPCGSRGDSGPRVATDGLGTWVLAWTSGNSLGETIGDDRDILLVFSTDDGVIWTTPSALNVNAAHDTGDDWSLDITTDGSGHWVAVWGSSDDLAGAIGSDLDILVARFAWPDCNANLRTDDEDIAAGFSSDENGDGIPDECEGDAAPLSMCPLAALFLVATAVAGIWVVRHRTVDRR